MGLQKYIANLKGDAQKNGAIPYFSKSMWGNSLALLRNCPIENADIPPRTVYVRGEADTWFSIPAACSYKGKTITGYITTNDDREYVFRAHIDQNLPPRKS